jgi:hypothetical protein
MIWKTIVLLAATALLAGAGPKAASKAAAPKPAPAKAAAVHAKAETSDAAFDARNPSNLIDILTAAGAHAEIARTEGDGVMLKVSSPAGSFQAQYAGCDAHGRSCVALEFDAGSEQRTAALAEINRFNQSSLTCRMIQDAAGKPHVLYSTLVFAETSRARMTAEVDGWKGCIAEFGAFLKDPTGYLASAP